MSRRYFQDSRSGRENSERVEGRFRDSSLAMTRSFQQRRNPNMAGWFSQSRPRQADVAAHDGSRNRAPFQLAQRKAVRVRAFPRWMGSFSRRSPSCDTENPERDRSVSGGVAPGFIRPPVTPHKPAGWTPRFVSRKTLVCVAVLGSPVFRAGKGPRARRRPCG